MSPSSIKLIKGANASLTELVPMLGTLVVGFGWRLIETRGPGSELVPSAIVCGEDGRALSDEHLVFFNQLAAPDGAVTYNEGDEEQVEVDLTSVPPRADKIVFAVYVDPDLRSPGTFASVQRIYARVCDRAGNEVVRYDVEDATAAEFTAMVLLEIYRHSGAWKVRAVGQGYSSGIRGVADDFGLGI